MNSECSARGVLLLLASKIEKLLSVFSLVFRENSLAPEIFSVVYMTVDVVEFERTSDVIALRDLESGNKGRIPKSCSRIIFGRGAISRLYRHPGVVRGLVRKF